MANPNDPTTPEFGAAPQTTDGQSDSGGSRIKRAAGEVADKAKSAAQKAVDQGKERVERSAMSASSVLRRAADESDAENAWLGSALRKTADGIENAARSITDGDLSTVVDQLNDFARRQPALFLGASLALGFAVARIGKTAMDRGNEQDTQSFVGEYGADYVPPETGI